MRNKGNNDFYRRFLRAYVIVLAVPMVFGLIVYQSAFTAVEEQAIDTHRAILSQIQGVVERSLREVERMALEIANDPKVRRFAFIEAPYTGPNAYAIVDTAFSLADRAFYNELILGYYVFFADNEMVLGPNFASRIRRFYPELVRYLGIPYTRWMREFVDRPHFGTYVPAHQVTLRDQEHRIITYLRSFPINGRSEGVVSILLDDSKLRGLFDGIKLDFGGWAAVIDDSGRVLTGTAAEVGDVLRAPDGIDLSGEWSEIERVDGRAMLVTSVTSSDSGWTYLAVVPVESVMHRVEAVRRVVVGTVLATLLVGLALATVMAYRHNKPVQLLVHDNRALQQELDAQAPFLRAAFLERLFRGELYSEQDTRTLVQHVDIDFDGAAFTVGIADVGTPAEGGAPDALSGLQRRDSWRKTSYSGTQALPVSSCTTCTTSASPSSWCMPTMCRRSPKATSNG